MKAYVITLKGNAISEKGTEGLINSSKRMRNKFEIEKFDAVTAGQARMVLSGNGLKWKYPWTGKETCLKSGLIKSAYQTANKNNRIDAEDFKILREKNKKKDGGVTTAIKKIRGIGMAKGGFKSKTPIY